MRCLVIACIFSPAFVAHCQSAEPTAVIDTTAGRITCTLLTHARPFTTAQFIGLAQGTEPWMAPDGSAGGGKPFYDGTRIYPHSVGIAVGNRATPSQQPAGAAFAVETKPPLLFDRPGLLAMTISKGNAGPSRLLITDHANTEADGRAVVFGQCDDTSVQLVATLRHTLQSTDNHPATPFAIDHIAIVPAGKQLPPPAPPVASEAILPVQPITPLEPPSGPEPTGPTAILETTVGSISCRLFTRESPIATSTFLGLVDGTKDWTDPRTHLVQHQHRFYDGMPIDRVLPDFYIQFGDITGDISGKTDIGFRFKNETTPGLAYDRPGRLAFGNAGPDTNNSELFFALNPMHLLDGAIRSSVNATQRRWRSLSASRNCRAMPRIVHSLRSSFGTSSSNLEDEDPCAGVDLQRVKRREMEALSVEECRRFLSIAEESEWNPLFALALTTDMRTSEYLALKWSDIDWQSGAVGVSRTIQVSGSAWSFDDTKRKRSRRVVKLQSFVLNALQTLREKQAASGEGNCCPANGLIFVTETGNTLGQREVKREFRRLLAKA